MEYRVFVNLGQGWVELTSLAGVSIVRREGFERSQTLHNEDLEPTLDTCRFSVTYRQEIGLGLISTRDDIPCRITRAGVPWFTGYIRPVTEIALGVGDSTIELEVVDQGYRLRRSPSAELHFTGLQICNPANRANSIVHQVLYAAGYVDADILINETISETSDVSILTDKTYWDELHGLLFDYGFVFFHDDAGRIRIYPWLVDTVPSPSATIADGQVIESMRISRDDRDDDTFRVRFFSRHTREGVQLLHQQVNVVSAGGTGFHRPTDPTWYWYELGELGDRNRYRIQRTTGHRVVVNSSGRSITVETQQLLSDRALLRFWIPAAFQPVGWPWEWLQITTFRSFGVVGDVTYLSLTNYSQVEALPDARGRLKTIDANHVYSATVAQRLCRGYRLHMEHGAFAYEFLSREDLSIGQYVSIALTSRNISTTVRIIEKKYTHGDPRTAYIAVAVAPLGIIVGAITEGTLHIPLTPGDLIATGSAVSAGLDGAGNVKLPVSGVHMPGGFAPQQSGLYMSAEMLGYFNFPTGEWTVHIRNTGTFRFGGDAARYIAWDGVQLIVSAKLLCLGESELRGIVTLGDDIVSGNYIPGVQGWRISGAGDAEFRDVLVRGDMQSTSKSYIQGRVVEGPLESAVYRAGEMGWSLQPSGEANFYSGLRTTMVRDFAGLMLWSGAYADLIASRLLIGRSLSLYGPEGMAFYFEGSANNHLGATWWASVENVRYSATRRYGDLAITSHVSDGVLHRPAWPGFVITSPWLVEFWLLIDPDIGAAGGVLVIERGADRVAVAVVVDSHIYGSGDYSDQYWSMVATGERRFVIAAGIVSVSLPMGNAAGDVVLRAWNYIGLSFQAGELRYVVNEITGALAFSPGVGLAADVTVTVSSSLRAIVDMLYVVFGVDVTHAQMLESARSAHPYGFIPLDDLALVLSAPGGVRSNSIDSRWASTDGHDINIVPGQHSPGRVFAVTRVISGLLQSQGYTGTYLQANVAGAWITLATEGQYVTIGPGTYRLGATGVGTPVFLRFRVVGVYGAISPAVAVVL